MAGLRLPLVHARSTTAPSGSLARVLLVGYEDGDNLGIRYLASRLREQGHHVVLVNVREVEQLVALVVRERPHVVGFSLIFQYLVPAFRAHVEALRRVDPHVHVVFGGHYASFEPAALLAHIPGVDSVARFEGEDTIVELAAALADGREWRGIAGLAHRGPQGLVEGPPRTPRDDLDSLPWPARDDIDYRRSPLPTASVLGSRGCAWKCSFCSIITFYAGNGTRGRRRRDPIRVVDELEYLYKERGVEIILWQDDDFLAGGRLATEWAHALAAECIRRGLDRGLRWKISCRSDEVKPAVIAPLVRAGLAHVYMGVEAGDPDSLRHMNKLLTPEVHLRAREVLLEHELSFDFGFMLFEPWSTLAIIRRNLAFLREFAAGGVASVGFGRMLPYAGTAVAEQLAAEGRLVVREGEADYEFLEPGVERLYQWVLRVLAERNYTAEGTANLLRRVLFEAALDRPGRPRDTMRLAGVRAIAAVSNRVLLDCVEQAIELVEADEPDLARLDALAQVHARQDRLLRSDLERVLARPLAYRHADAGAECPL